jgi:hypothetical protein
MIKLKRYQIITHQTVLKTATEKKQIPIASFIPIDLDEAAAKSNKRFMPYKTAQRINTKTLGII